MKYKVCVETTVDSYVEFESDKELTDEEIKEMTDKLLAEGSDKYKEFNPYILYSVGSGRGYSIDKLLQGE